MEDCCAVCAEPLGWTAFGECGHIETCSKCVSRLRFVLDDKRCAICQQECKTVFFARYAGKFTARLPPGEFAHLQERARHGELFYLQVIEGYFEDDAHFKRIRDLCSYTHPILNSESSTNDVRTFKNMSSLRRYILEGHNKHFCSVCLTGRKVFVSEQLLYSKQALDQHLKSGDEEGPMVESGFKGHPQCKFCKKRFFGQTELYNHNQQHHETCFLCRRSNPSEYRYYRDYNDMEEHFRMDHHPCPHPDCLERRFIVFGSDAELKQHFASEHKEDYSKGKSRAQLREAFALQTNFQFRRRGDDNDSEQILAESSGTVIGGGSNVHSRLATRRQRQGLDRDTAQAIENSLLTANNRTNQDQGPSNAIDNYDDDEFGHETTLNDEDFPCMGPSEASRPNASGAGGRWASSAGGNLSSSALRPEDFPSLPRTKSVKRRARQRSKTMADKLRAGQVKVVSQDHRRAPVARPAPATRPALLPRESRASPASESEPSTSFIRSSSPIISSQATTSISGSSPNNVSAPVTVSQHRSFGQTASQQQQPSIRLTEQPPLLAHAEDTTASIQQASPPVAPRPPAVPSVGFQQASSSESPGIRQDTCQSQQFQEDFPVLNSLKSSNSKSPQWPASLNQQVKWKPQNAIQQRNVTPSAGKKSSQSGSVPPRPEDFPSLAAAGLSGQSQRETEAPQSAVVAGAYSKALGGKEISDGLKAMNKALIQRIKRQVDAANFDLFRKESNAFMKGQLSAQDYHSQILSLGVEDMVVELAGLCPDEAKREELLSVHKEFVGCRKEGAHGWVPLKVLEATLDNAESYYAWCCSRCSLINAPQADFCEKCDTNRPQSTASSGDSRNIFRRNNSGERPHGSQKKKGKMSKFERVRLGDRGGGDDYENTAPIATSGHGKAKPGNAWAGHHPLRKGIFVKKAIATGRNPA